MISSFCKGFGFTLGIIFAIPVAQVILGSVNTLIKKDESEEEEDA